MKGTRPAVQRLLNMNPSLDNFDRRPDRLKAAHPLRVGGLPAGPARGTVTYRYNDDRDCMSRSESDRPTIMMVTAPRRAGLPVLSDSVTVT